MRRDAASDLGLGVAPIATALRTLVAGTTVGNWRAPDDQTYDVNVRLAPEVRNSPADLARLPFVSTAWAPTPTASQPHRAAVAGGRGARIHRARTRSTAAPWRARSASTPTSTGRSAGEVSADIRTALDGIAFPPGYG